MPWIFLIQVDESVVVFLLGRSSALEEESDLYGDLLQVAVEDSYRNMVYKVRSFRKKQTMSVITRSLVHFGLKQLGNTDFIH